MNDERRPDDLKNVWQSQSSSAVQHISVQDLQQRVRRLKDRNRVRKVAFYGLFAIYTLITLIVQTITGLQHMPASVELIRFALLIGWVSLWGRYHLSKEDNWLLSISPTSASGPGLEFYRNQLLNQREYFRQPYWINSQLIFVAFLLLLNAIAYPRLVIALCGIVAVSLGFLYMQRRRELPEIQGELAEVERLRKETT
jgi:hypothetical protein